MLRFGIVLFLSLCTGLAIAQTPPTSQLRATTSRVKTHKVVRRRVCFWPDFRHRRRRAVRQGWAKCYRPPSATLQADPKADLIPMP
jgi:hypothetical protein